MSRLTKFISLLLGMVCLAAAAPAFADSFSWTYAGGSDTGSGTFTANSTGTPGQFTITGVTGTWDGQTITGLLTPGTCCESPANDNLLFNPAAPTFLDLNGVAFGITGMTDINIYFEFSYAANMAPASTAPNGSTNTSTNAAFNVAAAVAPEPGTLSLMLSALLGLGLLVGVKRYRGNRLATEA